MLNVVLWVKSVVQCVVTVETVENHVETTNGRRPAVGSFGYDSFDSSDTLSYAFDPQCYSYHPCVVRQAQNHACMHVCARACLEGRIRQTGAHREGCTGQACMCGGDLRTIANYTAQSGVKTVGTVETVESHVENTNGRPPAVGTFDVGSDSFDSFDRLYYAFDAFDMNNPKGCVREV